MTFISPNLRRWVFQNVFSDAVSEIISSGKSFGYLESEIENIWLIPQECVLFHFHYIKI